MPTVHLRPGREASLLRRHPWVFSGAVARVEGDSGSSPEVEPGETVEVRSAGGELLGRGAYSPASQIRVRLWTFDPSEEVGPDLFRRRIERALATRLPVPAVETPSARRLVHAESDGLPGLVVDRYGESLVCQFLSAGPERWRDEIVAALREVLEEAPGPRVRGIWERSDVDVRSKEGLEERTGLLWGDEPPELVEVRETGPDGPTVHLADLRRGHKTGLYLDQRRNRRALAEMVAAGGLPDGAEVLNCFAYTGAFGHAVQAAGGDRIARVTHVETSEPALELLRRTAEANGFDPASIETVEGNVFSVLRGYRADSRRFDLVILDPPRFVESRRQLDKAARGYKDINLLAFQLLRPGGLLATFSCSGLLPADLFHKIVADAALDAGRDARILRHLTQADDHPTALSFPEGRYLKGLICRAW